MASDRSFGMVEKLLRKKESIFLLKKYEKIFKKAGEVLLLEKDFDFHELKGFFGQIATKVQNIKKQNKKSSLQFWYSWTFLQLY